LRFARVTTWFIPRSEWEEEAVGLVRGCPGARGFALAKFEPAGTSA